MTPGAALRAGIPVEAFNRRTYDGHPVCTFITGELHADGRDDRMVEIFLCGLPAYGWGSRKARRISLLPYVVVQAAVHEADLYTAVELELRIAEILRDYKAQVQERFRARMDAIRAERLADVRAKLKGPKP